jgi:hypothetical protein
MDLLTITPCETADMSLCHPVTGEAITGADGAPVIFKLAGADSVAFRNASRNIANKRMTRKKGELLSVESVDADNIGLLSECVMGWSGNFNLGGQVPEYSKDKAFELINSHVWIREQIDRFVGSRANFLPKA